MRRARSQYEWRQFGGMVMALNVVRGLPGVRLYGTLPVAGWIFPPGNCVMIVCRTCITPAEPEFRVAIALCSN